MACVLGVSRSGYYEFIDRAPSKRALENEALLLEIKKVHKNSRGTYGSPRVHAKLKSLGSPYSRTRVAKLMRKEGLQAKMRKKWKVTTKPSKKALMIKPNHLDKNFTLEAPNKVWASVISYVFTEEGWLYVAVVMDLFLRRIVGLTIGDRLGTDLVMKALKQALYRREVSGGVLHDSDRRWQYTSKEFRDFL
jgi:transposase InsO family protein